MSAVAFRPYLPSDASRCAAIFRDAIEFSAADGYDDDQRAAWAARADDEEAFGAKLAGQLTIVATLEGFVVAFASLKGSDRLDMLYVDPAAGRRGVAAPPPGGQLPRSTGRSRAGSDEGPTHTPAAPGGRGMSKVTAANAPGSSATFSNARKVRSGRSSEPRGWAT